MNDQSAGKSGFILARSFIIVLCYWTCPADLEGQVSYTPLHTFSYLDSESENSDGAFSQSPLVMSGNILFGACSQGGPFGSGTIFRVNTDGTDFVNIYNFSSTQYNGSGEPTNSDGYLPRGVLVLSGDTLYGTTAAGGFGVGTIYAVNTDGSGFAVLHSFSLPNENTGINSDGAGPEAGLILSGNRLYGTTSGGGPFEYGTVFGLNVDGTGFTIVHGFNGIDGSYPRAEVTVCGNTLYGTTYGGTAAVPLGSVFRVNTDGSAFTNLYSFTSAPGSTGNPWAGLAISDNSLFGMTTRGGSGDPPNGIIFKINKDGSGFMDLYNWGDGDSAGLGRLIVAGQTLYGASYGGNVFAINTDGSAFTNLYFTANWSFGLILSDNTLYGTTYGGYDSSPHPVVFSLSSTSINPQPNSSPEGEPLPQWSIIAIMEGLLTTAALFLSKQNTGGGCQKA